MSPFVSVMVTCRESHRGPCGLRGFTIDIVYGLRNECAEPLKLLGVRTFLFSGLPLAQDKLKFDLILGFGVPTPSKVNFYFS